ncbi:MAG: oligosaccharide flippase family protein [Pleurocapsa sp.]
MKPTKLIKSSFWITVSTFAQRFFALLSNLILARLLLPSEFGVIAIAYVFWSFFTLFTQSSTGFFILYKGTEDKRYLDTTYTIGLIIGLIVALGLVVTAPFVAIFFNEPNLKLLLLPYALNLQLSTVYYTYAAVMTSQMQHRELANINFISSAARLILTTGAALAGFSYWSFAVGDTAFWLLGSFLARDQSGHHLQISLNAKLRNEVISYCAGEVGSSFGFYANSNLDNFVAGKFLGQANLGYYNLAYQLSMALSTILNPVINQLGIPLFAKMNHPQQQKKALFEITKEIAFLATPLFILVFLVLDKSTLALIFGANWTPVASILPWLLFAAYFRVLNSPLRSMLVAKGLPKINATVNLTIAPIAVVGFYLGAKYGGVIGVSIAAALVLGIVWTLYWWWLGCNALGWSIGEFMIPCFQPMLISLLPLLISVSLPSIVKAIAFGPIYLIFLRFFAAQQFFNYYKFAISMVHRIFNKNDGNSLYK